MEISYEYDLTKIINSNKFYGKMCLANGKTIDKAESWRKKMVTNEMDNFFKSLKGEEIFLLGFFEYMGNAVRILEQLQTIMCCFACSPSNKKLIEWNIKKTAIKEYHIESFYHRIYTFRESVFQLINFIYFLKLNERDVNRNTIFKKFTENHSLYDKEIKILLEEIENILKPINDTRRKSVHYGKFFEFNITILNIYELSGKDIDKLNNLRGKESNAKYLSSDLFIKMSALELDLMKIFKRLFNKACEHSYLIFRSYKSK